MTEKLDNQLAGYQLIEKIGEGAYGAVFRARQEAVERQVAVKIILPEFANRPEFIRRFETEAQLVAQLEHIHIVPLYDYWRDPQGAYLVMRLMKGGSLAELVEKGPLPLPQAAQLLEQIASALSAAHRRKIIHRDLKPANILLDEDGNAYLSDFGIAKAIGEQADLTATGAILGTPAFITPEQVQSMPVSPQTDIYALGVVLFTMLSGQHPFPETSPGDLIARHLRDPLPVVNQINPQLPSGLDQVIQKATAKDPAERYPDIESMLVDFHQVLGPELSPTPAHPLTEQTLAVSNPYKGLRPFLEADADDFFGREELTRQLLSRLGESSQFSRFLAVVGPSGSGKSSLVKAGLLPALRQGALHGSEKWFIVTMTPGARPIDELEVSLMRVAAEIPPDLAPQLQRDRFGLLRAAQLVLPGEDEQLLIVVDQFEELFTLTSEPAQARHFMDLIFQAITDPHSQVQVVITLRADFYDRPLMEPDFSALVQKRTEVVVPLTSAELERAICGPIERVGVSLEPGLESRIISDVADQPGSLPLLQYALTELFERRQGRLLTREAYQSIGAVLGALGRRAEEVYQGLSKTGQALSRQVFLRLVSLGEGIEDTRRRVLRAELTDLASPAINPGPGAGAITVDQVLESYGSARLLSFDHDPQTRAPTVEVAHEALLREWEHLRGWLDESRNDIRLQRMLGSAAQDWLASDQDPSFLLRGSRLAQFEEWSKETSLALTADEGRFLQTSLEDEARRKVQREKLERRSRNFLRALVAVFAVAAVVAVILTIFAFNQQGIAQDNAATAVAEADARATQQVIAESEANARATQQAIAESEAIARGEAEQQAIQERNEARKQAAIGLAGMALNELSGDKPERAVPLALEAVENFPYTWQAHKALGMTTLNHKLDLIFQHEGIITEGELSKDGKRLLSSSNDGKISIWDMNNGEKLLELSEIATPIALWSPDESRMWVLENDCWSFQMRNGSTGELLYSQQLDSDCWLTSGGSSIWSPNGDRFLTAHSDGSVRIWDTATGNKLLHLTTQEGITNANWSPDGSYIIGFNHGVSELTAWNADNGEALYTLELPATTHDFADWSITGDQFVIRGEGWARIYDTASGMLQNEILTPGVRVSRVKFSPDGMKIITSGLQDGIARLWDAKSGKMIGMIGGLIQAQNIAWSPSGILAAVTGGNGIHIWNTSTNTREYLLPFIIGDTSILDWTPDERRIVFASPYASEARAYDISWDLITLPDILGVNASEWSPDGQQIVIQAGNGTSFILNAETGEVEHTFDAGGWGGLSWSPSGDRILTGSQAGLRVWDAADGDLLIEAYSPGEEWFYVAWSPDGSQIVSTSSAAEDNVVFWDAVSLDRLRSFTVEKGPLIAISWSPDGARVATTGMRGEGSIRDANTGEVILRLMPEEYAEQVGGIIWTNDGTQVILSTPGTSYRFDATTGEELMQYTGYSDISFDIELSDDEKLVYFMLGDGTARVFDVDKGVELLVYEAGGWASGGLSPDNKELLLTSSTGGDVSIYPAWQTLDELIAYTKECCLIHELTPDEREQFGLPPE